MPPKPPQSERQNRLKVRATVRKLLLAQTRARIYCHGIPRTWLNPLSQPPPVLFLADIANSAGGCPQSQLNVEGRPPAIAGWKGAHCICGSCLSSLPARSREPDVTCAAGCRMWRMVRSTARAAAQWTAGGRYVRERGGLKRPNGHGTYLELAKHCRPRLMACQTAKRSQKNCPPKHPRSPRFWQPAAACCGVLQHHGW